MVRTCPRAVDGEEAAARQCAGSPGQGASGPPPTDVCSCDSAWRGEFLAPSFVLF